MTSNIVHQQGSRNEHQDGSESRIEGPRHVGRSTSRVDGVAKVTGQAKYSAEFHAHDLAYGVIVSSPVAKGKILAIETEAALAVEGVLKVYTYRNCPKTAQANRKFKDDDAPPGEHIHPLQDDLIRYSHQPLALVIATSFEAARYAASLVRVQASTEDHATDLKVHLAEARAPKGKKSGFEPPKSRGDFKKAYADAPVKIEANYSMVGEHHNPMEMHASTVIWKGEGELEIYDKTQGVANSQQFVCNVFGLDPKKVQVLSLFVGGAFGSGLRPQYQLMLATLAALDLKRSVRVVMTRQQMFSFGYRPNTEQNLKLAARLDGSLLAISHHATGVTSRFEEYGEIVVNWSGLAYQCENVDLDYKLLPLDLATPLDMRAPGATVGLFAFESAIDELAYRLKMDPLAFRLKNYAERDQIHDQDFSSKELREAYQQAAAKFGWANRSPEAGSLKRNEKWVGSGMATGIWDASQQPASAKAMIDREGGLTVSSAITDIGTGTYTIMSQIAADAFGIPLSRVVAKLGDSSLPQAPLQGGSWTAASVGWAVQSACQELKIKLVEAARQAELLDHRLQADDLAFADGRIRSRDGAIKNIDLGISEICDAARVRCFEVSTQTIPNVPQQTKYSRHTHSAVFVEVEVDDATSMIEVTRVVIAVAAGRILNPKTARSQVLGGVVWGVSMALHEGSHVDHSLGRIMNHSFAEYHISVARDIGSIEVIFVDEHDEVVSPMGVKGLGEIGIVGTAAAVANAVYHAVGRRVRSLPITPDKLI